MIKLTPAFIDGKNIVSDFVYEYLYDNSVFVFSSKDEAVGFVNDIPIHASYKKETMTLKYPKTLSMLNKQKLLSVITKRLMDDDRGVEDVFDYSTIYIGECQARGMEKDCSVALKLEPDAISIAYYWQQQDL